MNSKRLFTFMVVTCLLGTFIFAIASAQMPKRMTDLAPANRPPVEREVAETPAIPDELPEGIHLLEGPRRLILQDLTVVILVGDEAIYAQTVVDFLLASGHVMTVDVIDISISTPALVDIEGYDAVICWTNYWPADPVALGDLLADYIDLGKGVIALEGAFSTTWGLQGRFMAEYSPYVSSDIGFTDVTLGTYDPEHPLMADVSAATDYFVFDLSLTGNATCVAWWDNDWPFVAYNSDNNLAVGINSFPHSTGPWTGDLMQVILNSVLFVTGGMPEICQLSKCTTPLYAWGSETVGDKIVTFFDPADCPGSPTYPFAITSIDMQLILYYGSYPVDVDVVVFDMANPGDFCAGPGAELCRFSLSCDESFEFPNVGTFTFPEPCCVEGPFFIGIEYLDPVEAVAVYDAGPPVICDVWFNDDGVWYEWYDMWGGVGYPMFWVYGETYSPECQEQPVPTLSEWGMMIMGLLLLVAGTVAVVKRRKAALSRAV